MQSEFGKLIDMSDEDFLKFFDDKDLGYIMGFMNYEKIIYEQVKMQYDALMKKIKDEGETDEAKNLLVEVCAQLLRIEGKYFLLKDKFFPVQKSG